MAIIGPIKVTTTGSAGAATGDTTLDFEIYPHAILEAVYIDYDGSAPATTDVTISETEGLERDLLTLTDNNTDGTYYPRHALHDDTGSETGSKGPYIIEGPIKVAVAGCDALTDAVQVYLQVVGNKNVS